MPLDSRRVFHKEEQILTCSVSFVALGNGQVLEALNRLLDHNRELYLSETQETIKPHPLFRLFATQNPPGAYGGRKPLSRAFRNRFMEVSVGYSE